MKENSSSLAAFIAFSVLSTGTNTQAQAADRASYEVPMSYLLTLELHHPGIVSQWLRETEQKVQNKIHVTTHEETSIVDISCFDCDAVELGSSVLQLSPYNDELKDR